MGRRKRKVIRVVKKRLPKVFTCPKCGYVAVRVIMKRDKVVVACGSCSEKREYTQEKGKDPIDYYNMFVDELSKGV